MKRVSSLICFHLILFSLLLPAVSVTATDTPAEVPAPNMITMVDLGAHKCIPCKMMAPILKKLTSEYEGRAAVIFIDVWKDPSQGKKFKISTIPTQIFFDEQGKEVYRHQGFLSEEDIVSQFAKMGVKQPAKVK
ncbi:MAG: thioredoxin [Candidatus Electrothrix sp. AU1_5]|nr:thioredoxin [Candidatus Electrothrix sp. AX1]MCI5129410.1 thioredoxin [Candidatus Electrothrix gigas]MCI5183097.1 thioredoxin [Candidatus Electrothrix gigas]MCI5191064.1 thioredoxin [Candidatus Electrothrix gigas]MCI5193132.1 thioredoxin [Candidatus Electrothrix gigas]